MKVVTTVRAAAIAAAALLLTACAGLPTSGPVGIVGLPSDDAESDAPFTEVASGPTAGAGPEEIVAGFLEASITPSESWSIARQFLSPELAETWRPSAGVSIDAAGSPRTYASSIEDVEASSAGSVVVELDQRASVDESGQYTEAVGDTELVFQVERDADGEWRITSAPDGIVLDEVSFQQVYDSYALQYFDRTWTHLVSDVRWYPRRSTIATTITQAVVEGQASEWLAPAVQSAFPADVLLDGNSVPVTAQVADVALTEVALSLDTTTLARMRTQLEHSLSSAGVTEVRFTVDGRELEAGTVTLANGGTETSTLVLTEDGFGSLIGGEVSSVAGVSAELEQIEQPIVAIDVAQDAGLAAVQLDSGAVYAVSEGRVDELDARADLVRPSIDPYGYIWTVPSSDPQAVTAWSADVASHDIADAWPEASAISALRVSADGVRIAALVTMGGHQSVVTAVILRDDDGMPTGLGPVRELAELSTPATGLSWLGTDSLGILVTGEDAEMITQVVGGPGETQAAPSGSVSIAGATTTGGVRVLGADGVLFTPRVSAWQEYFQGALVLGTRAGY